RRAHWGPTSVTPKGLEHQHGRRGVRGPSQRVGRLLCRLLCSPAEAVWRLQRRLLAQLTAFLVFARDPVRENLLCSLPCYAAVRCMHNKWGQAVLAGEAGALSGRPALCFWFPWMGYPT